MGIRFIQCTTTAQADELLDAGLLWVNQDSSQERMFPEWQIAHQHHRMYTGQIDSQLNGGDPNKYWCTDFAYALED